MSSDLVKRIQTHVPKANLFIKLLFVHVVLIAPTGISYGSSQPPITDVNQLMPKLCQNQSVICEGSFCIPGVRRCVCDLRMPVQFDKFCLRQLDIESKCFVTNQCNHTVKDAVCIDINSNSILDVDASRFKLEQWHQLNELRSQSTKNRIPSSVGANKQTQSFVARSSMFMLENGRKDILIGSSQDEPIVSKARNSPYEINYNTNELLIQNHTRRRTNSTERPLDTLNIIPIPNPNSSLTNDAKKGSQSISIVEPQSVGPAIELVQNSTTSTENATTSASPLSQDAELTTNPVITTSMSPIMTSSDANLQTTTSIVGELANRKMVTKTPHWPPGVCSCPFGYMFDSMLRKCLALSLSDSHCQSDSDCKNIPTTHCSKETKKCECDEPFVWDQKDLACLRPKFASKDTQLDANAVVDSSLLPATISSRLFLENTNFLLILILLLIVSGALFVIESTVKCFSSKNSALISPKRNQKKQKQSPATSGLPPRSPYATLRRPEHQSNSQLSSFTKATRGRILNYDFEQDSPKSNSTPPIASNTLKITFLLLF